jgi:hypothetical protein
VDEHGGRAPSSATVDAMTFDPYPDPRPSVVALRRHDPHPFDDEPCVSMTASPG